MNYTKYKNLSGKSNVAFYNITEDSIEVVFNGSNRVYRYSYKSAGKRNVDELISRARKGYGLNSYINRFCKYLYER